MMTTTIMISLLLVMVMPRLAGTSLSLSLKANQDRLECHEELILLSFFSVKHQRAVLNSQHIHSKSTSILVDNPKDQVQKDQVV